MSIKVSKKVIVITIPPTGETVRHHIAGTRDVSKAQMVTICALVQCREST
jgi:hypothetical protein